jgi:SAM-dependent methyltransferase
MDQVSCPACNDNRWVVVLEGPDRVHGLPGTFRMVRCQQCGLIYQNPRLSRSDIARFYPDDYLPFSLPVEAEQNWLRRVDWRYGVARRCQIVTRHAGSPGQLLDVGCATGVFLDAIRRLGWQVTGVETSVAASQYARRRFALSVHTGELRDAGLPDRAMDAVTMWDVLEHVQEPLDTLRELARVIRPGGSLLLTLPNPNSWEARLLGRYWPGWDLPRHLCLFVPELISRCLAACGFDVISISPYPRLHVIPAGIALYVAERVRSRALRSLALESARGWPLRLAMLPVSVVANRFFPSAIMCVVGRRRDT